MKKNTKAKSVKKMALGTVPHHPNEVHRIDLPDGIPRPPVLGMYVGKRGQGKSTAAVRLMKYYLDHKPPCFQKELVFVISPTAESQYHLWDYMGIDQENVFVGHTEKDVRAQVNDIIFQLEKARTKYDEDQEYLEAYDKLVKEQFLTPREIALLEARDAHPLNDPAPWPRPCLILDDLSHMKVLDKPWFISLCLRHRHVAGGVSLSLIIICQSLHGGLSRVVRQNCSLICLFSTHDKTCIDDLYKECSHLLNQEEFEAVFANATDDFHSFMAVDLSQHDPNMVFSRNFEHWYNIRHQNALPDNENIKPCSPQKKNMRL